MAKPFPARKVSKEDILNLETHPLIGYGFKLPATRDWYYISFHDENYYKITWGSRAWGKKEAISLVERKILHEKVLNGLYKIQCLNGFRKAPLFFQLNKIN